MSRTEPRKALVIGGSIGGLFAACFLARAGWRVVVHERAVDELGARGAGIVTHDPLHALLERASGKTDLLGVAVSARAVYSRTGETVCDMPRPQMLASWDRVWHRLRDAFDGEYHRGSLLTAVDQTSGTALATFATGETVDADLIVAVDGIQSTIRKQIFPNVRTRYAGYVAWRGLIDEMQLAPASRAQFEDHFAFCLPPQEQMLGYRVDGPIVDGEMRCRFNYVWYRPADAIRALPRLLTAADGRWYEDAIPPDRIHPDVLREMRDDADRCLSPAFADAVRNTAQPLLQPIVDLETPKMTHGRVVLLGDAAFVARPHVGMGVTKAAEDAGALVDALTAHDDIHAALAAYNAARIDVGRRIIRRARHLGAYMQAQLSNAEERAQAERHRTPEAVMRETATMDGIETW